eukprot:gene11817-24760_t
MQSSEWILNLVTILGDVLPDDQKPPMRQSMIAFYDPPSQPPDTILLQLIKLNFPHLGDVPHIPHSPCGWLQLLFRNRQIMAARQSNHNASPTATDYRY